MSVRELAAVHLAFMFTQQFPTLRVMSFSQRRTSLSKLLPVALSAMLAILPLSQANAVALGEASVRSALGQKLDAVIDITSISAAESESLAVRLAPASMFTDAGLDYGALQRSLRLSVEKKGDRTSIRLSSELPVSDPFLMLLIEVNAAGNRTVRQYALLLDPPAIEQDAQQAAATVPSTILPDTQSPAPSPASTKQDKTKIPGQSLASLTRIVRSGDTLAKLARDTLPPGATLEQGLLAYLQANPRAFEGKNIHRMKTGSVLRVPDDQAVADIPADQARREVALQTADYRRYRNMLARSAVQPADKFAQSGATDAPGNRSSSGKVSVQEAKPGSADNAHDQLKLEPAAQDKPGAGEQQESQHRELAQIANDKALADANSRIAELEKNIGQMQQQLAIRNQTLADTQQRADQSVSGTQSAQDAAPAKSPETPKPRAAKVAPTPPPEEEGVVAQLFRLSDQLTSDPLSLPGSLGILSAGILMLWLRARLKKRQQPAIRIEPKSETQSVFAQAGGRNVDTSNSVFHSNFVPSVSQLDANEVDAIAEADVYIAYGRDEQAEEILLDALKHHPERHALRVKLLEIYLARKDTQKFGAVAAELLVMTHGQGHEWTQASLMGQQLDPGNLLYGGPPASVTVMGAAPTNAVPNAAPKAAAFAPATSPASAAPAKDAQPTPAASPLTHSPVQPPLGLLRPDESMAQSSSAVDDFGLKLEGLLDERRKDPGMGLSLAPMDSSPVPRRAEQAPVEDFQLSGIGQVASVGGEAKETKADAVALKTKIDLALACQEIGDKEAARELLTEVAGTRHPELASRAQSLLRQLA